MKGKEAKAPTFRAFVVVSTLLIRGMQEKLITIMSSFEVLMIHFYRR